MPQCHWFLDRTLLGVGVVPERAESVVFYCEACGELWARCLVAGSSRHILTHRPCSRHTSLSAVDYGQIPGTLVSWRLAADSPYWDTAHCLEYLPRGVLKREFEILAQHYLDRSIDHDEEASSLTGG